VLFVEDVKKGEDTKNAILDAGMDMASRLGLEGVSIGALSKASHMSKSGLFAHFQSKENLQVEILNHAAEVFAESVVIPALKTASGIPRIKALVDHWIAWTSTISGGCIFVTASNDFSDRPGPVRDRLLLQQKQWLDCLSRIARSAMRVGDFREDIDCEQFAFELYSLLLGFHLYYKLLNSSDTESRQKAALDRLLDNFR
jgi:AcrR family transcriptional regulator